MRGLPLWRSGLRIPHLSDCISWMPLICQIFSIHQISVAIISSLSVLLSHVPFSFKARTRRLVEDPMARPFSTFQESLETSPVTVDCRALSRWIVDKKVSFVVYSRVIRGGRSFSRGRDNPP